MNASSRLREILAGDEIVLAPGVFDGLSARLVEGAGFPVVYASGGAIARSIGLPDLGLLSMGEIVTRLGQIVDAVQIPVIADADNGYGSALNAWRAVKAFAGAGVAGLHIEDQAFPKRCGHFEGKALVPAAEFVQKIRAACDAAAETGMVIVARTDAIAVEGFAAAIDRAQAYAEAGADMVFVEAPESEEQIAEIARLLPQPKLINMFHGGKTPLVPLDRLAALGYRVAIVPSDLQRVVIRAMQRTLEAIRRDGNSAAVADALAPLPDRDLVVDTARYLDLERRYST